MVCLAFGVGRLIAAIIFPVLKSVHDLLRKHELDPVALLVSLGLATSILALFFGGDPRILLIRESSLLGPLDLPA